MPYQKIKGAASTVASYSTGLLTVATGTGGRFGSPSAENPLLLQTGAAGVARASAYLVCTGRTGDVLTVELQDVEGTPGTIADGDFVAAGEAVEFWTEVYEVIAGKQAAISLTTTGTGGPATLDGGVLNIPQYDAGESGGITALTGDVTASGTGSVPATIAAKAVTYAKVADASGAGLLGATGAGAHQLLTLGTGLSLSGTTLNATLGTVTSVGIALPTSVFTNGSAVTSTGNLTASLKTQAANTVFAGPATGADAAPTFRALVAADISPLLTDYATTSALSSHTSNTSNPHSVTKSQVGLGSVDNTSDLGKPISTLTQAALDGKQATLPTGQSAAKFLGGDFAFHDLPARKDLICLGQWTSSGSSPLTAGDMAPQASLFPADFEVLYVSVIAKTNGGSGGFTFNLSINGVDLFATAQSYAASTTTLAVISSGFAVSSITGGAEILAAIATAGSGVLSVTIALHGRPA